MNKTLKRELELRDEYFVCDKKLHIVKKNKKRVDIKQRLVSDDIT